MSQKKHPDPCTQQFNTPIAKYIISSEISRCLNAIGRLGDEPAVTRDWFGRLLLKLPAA